MNGKNFISWLGSGYAVLDITKIARIITKENTKVFYAIRVVFPHIIGR